MNRYKIIDRQGLVVQQIRCARYLKDFSTGALHFLDEDGMVIASVFSDGIITVVPEVEKDTDAP